MIHANVMLVLFRQDLCRDKVKVSTLLSVWSDGLLYLTNKSDLIYSFHVFFFFHVIEGVETSNCMLSRLHVPTKTRFFFAYNNFRKYVWQGQECHACLLCGYTLAQRYPALHANISTLACSQWNCNMLMYGGSFSTTSILVKAAPRNFTLCRFWHPLWTKVVWALLARAFVLHKRKMKL